MISLGIFRLPIWASFMIFTLYWQHTGPGYYILKKVNFTMWLYLNKLYNIFLALIVFCMCWLNIHINYLSYPLGWIGNLLWMRKLKQMSCLHHTHTQKCMHAQLYPTLCNPMHYSPPRSSVHGIFQARILEWVAISSSRGSSWPRDWTHVSRTSRQILYH